MGSNTEEAVEKILSFLEDKEFDIFIAGPAFQAGRYGVACGTICKAVKEKFDVLVLTSMNEENPGVEMFKKEIVEMSKKGSMIIFSSHRMEHVELFCKKLVVLMKGKSVLEGELKKIKEQYEKGTIF